MNPGLRFAIHTFGCKLNFSESSQLARQLVDAGYARVGMSENPDILVINTCSVTENADKKCRQLIRQSRASNPSIFVAVIGCYAQLKPKQISSIPGVNLVLGASEKFNLAEHLQSSGLEDEVSIAGGPIKEVKNFEPSYSLGDRTRAFLKVQDGCDYFCSFCTIPLARGLSRSPQIGQVVGQAKEIAASGVREIVLSGVNIGDFGAGRDESLLNLISELDKVEGIERFRISSIEPNLLTDEIISFVATSERFVPHFHVPLQSGSDKILEGMRRKYNTDLYREKIGNIRKVLPEACIGVDVITGFPGETEVEFKETVDFLLSLEVNYLHVFTYSERDNTRAKRMEEKVPVEERRKRTNILQGISEKMKRAFYLKYCGKEMDVLFESENEGSIGGFTQNYIRVEMPYTPGMENTVAAVKLIGLNQNGDVEAELIGETQFHLA